MKNIILFFIVVGMLASCKQQNAATDAEALDHGHDHGALSVLLFEDGMELFAETDQLFAKHSVEIRAHLTFLSDYSPAHEGTLSARIVQDKHTPDWISLDLSQPGIFIGSVLPGQTGECQFQFRYQEDELEVVFIMDELMVYSHDDDAPVAEHLDGLSYTKEQAWQTVFGLQQINEASFSQAIHCSGSVMVSPGNEFDIVAPAPGKVIFSERNWIEGNFVRKGEVLFTLSGTGLGEENVHLELNTAYAEYEKSKADFDRKKELIKGGAVSQKEFDEAKTTYEIAKTRYDILKGQLSESGIIIKSPATGYLTKLLVGANAFTETGSILAKVLTKANAIIQANVPSIYANKLNEIGSANIKKSGQGNTQVIEKLEGKILSIGQTVDPQTGMISIFFSTTNNELLPGAFVELWLLTEAVDNQIVIPKTAFVEEYGLYYVFVQIGGETYEKRLVQVAGDDGQNYHIAEGLDFGEVIVSKGAMAVKIANALGAPPAHTH